MSFDRWPRNIFLTSPRSLTCSVSASQLDTSYKNFQIYFSNTQLLHSLSIHLQCLHKLIAQIEASYSCLAITAFSKLIILYCLITLSQILTRYKSLVPFYMSYAFHDLGGYNFTQILLTVSYQQNCATMLPFLLSSADIYIKTVPLKLLTARLNYCCCPSKQDSILQLTPNAIQILYEIVNKNLHSIIFFTD